MQIHTEIKYMSVSRKLFPVFLTVLLLLSAFAWAEEPLPAMRWRLVGPLRAGWSTSASGITDKPNTFYFGAANGGVWKTVNAGQTWQPLMQQEASASIGALAVAPSNPDIIYAGTGQVTMRYDIASGDGVYRSADGGKSWQNMGLKKTRHIGGILVDPKNAQRVLVGAMGAAFAPNPERGVYLTTDGGKKWKQVLKIDDATGVVDMAWDADNTQIVYAAAWQFRQHPWLDYFQPQEGPGSAIYKSRDGGLSWQRLKGRGLPAGNLGRIGLATPAGSNGQVVYATVAASKGAGFYRSEDGGESWKLLNTDPELSSDYFCRVTIAPDNPKKVYVMARSIHMSDDGGHTFSIIKGSPGGDDYHFMWINPKYPDHLISAADQGTAVSVDGGLTWSSWYNQPTGQFYHVAADDQFPYKIYSGQQDNGTVQIKSRGPYGVIEERDWRPVGGHERDYQLPKPGNPNIVLGSGLGGYISRSNQITREVVNVSPWPISSYGARLDRVKNRYTWITPIAYSPVGKRSLYFGAQQLFRSDDDGDNWQIISPDLSAKKPGAPPCVGNPSQKDARDCGYGVIFTIAPSPIDEKMIWIGTDDGLIHRTSDAGKSWRNVTPAVVKPWGRINAISPSVFDQNVAYAAVDAHRTGDYRPLIIKTNDGGAHWTSISNGLPADQFVLTVRADTKQAGLLFAGTNRGAFVSFDDGGNWQSLQLNLPTTFIRDMQVHGTDLIAGTQGRGIWALDILAPLRQIAEGVKLQTAHLFKPSATWRLRKSNNHDTPPPPETPLGQNPPAGAVIDYWLQDDNPEAVTLTIKDAQGKLIRRFSSADKPQKLTANQYFQDGWIAPEKILSAKAGMHRFVWDLRHPRARSLNYGFKMTAVWHDGTPIGPQGALVLPGDYSVELEAGKKTMRQIFTVKMDPRSTVGIGSLQAQQTMVAEISTMLNSVVDAYHHLKMRLDKVSGMDEKTALKKILLSGKPSLKSLAASLSTLLQTVQGADAAPTAGQKKVFGLYRKQYDTIMQNVKKVE